MKFINAIKNQNTTTTNGMTAHVSTGVDCLDLFGSIGACRNGDITTLFSRAYNENREYALRIAQYARDIRDGLGERKVFCDIIKYLEVYHKEDAELLLYRTAELGRFKDLLCVETPEMKEIVAYIFAQELLKKNALVAKWLPSENGSNKEWAKYLRESWKLSPKQYRKLKSSLNKVVEQQLCAKKFDEIIFEHVPSLASVKYKKTFFKHQQSRYSQYLEDVANGTKKINVGNALPHEILKQLFNDTKLSKDDIRAITVQWDALKDLTQGKNMLPIVDTSGSMNTGIGGNTTAWNISVALGLYCADKNKGAFNGAFVAFSDKPKIQFLNGNIVDKYKQISKCDWMGSTNLEKTFDDILKMASDNSVKQEDMPEYVIIFSDMQFNAACNFDNNPKAFNMIKQQYKNAGYEMPKIIFWNLVARDNTPVRFDDNGSAFVSGYTPNLLTAVLADITEYTPLNIMLNAIMKDKYAI